MAPERFYLAEMLSATAEGEKQNPTDLYVQLSGQKYSSPKISPFCLYVHSDNKKCVYYTASSLFGVCTVSRTFSQVHLQVLQVNHVISVCGHLPDVFPQKRSVAHHPGLFL